MGLISFAVVDSGSASANAGSTPVDPAASAVGAREFQLRHASLLGPDDAPIHGEVRFSDGLIKCEKRSGDACALSVQFPIPPADGPVDAIEQVVTLQTCLLPERERPYLLSLELVRHRLMLILNKLEEWALFDLPADAPAMKELEGALTVFTEACVAAGGSARTGAAYTPAAESASRRALALAMRAGDTLVEHQARSQHAKRFSGELAAAAAAVQVPANAITEHEAAASRNALLGTVGVILNGPPQIGVRIAPDQFSPSLQKLVQSTCDFLCMPMRWVDMEPTEGKYLFAKTDRWIEWAVRQAKLPIVGGPVIDFRPRCVPEWLYIWEHDYETLRELVYEHIKNIVTRYRRTVGTWTVVGGLHVNQNFSFSFDQVMDLTRLAVMVVRKLQPSARVQVEIDQPWGDYHTDNARSVPPMLYAEMIGQAGLNVDQFSLRVDMGQPETGRCTRDPMTFSAMLDRYAALEKPLCISALSCPSQPPDTESLGLNRQLDPGRWRFPWSPASQAAWMAEFVAIAASKPYVQSVCWGEFYDSERPADCRHDGLISSRGEPKPALQRLADLRQALREKRPLLAEVGAAPALATGVGAR